MINPVFMGLDKLLSLMGSGVIVYAATKAMVLFVKGIFDETLDINMLRLDLGYGIILGLEFMIGADIIESMAQPTYHDIGILGALVVIRTFLSYVLQKELEMIKARTTSRPAVQSVS